MNIHATYSTLRVVSMMSTDGRPSTAMSSTSGIASEKLCGGLKAVLMMRMYVSTIAIGSTTVPRRSMKTTNCIEKQNVPHRFRTSTSSIRLCTVELIHRRRCESRTLNVSGTTVRQRACGRNIILRFGNVRSSSVVRKRSSPSSSRFFSCSVVTTDCEYSLTISGLMMSGTQSSPDALRALMRNMEKQPGRHVTPPKTDSNALAMWCEMKYSKTWIVVTHDCRLFAMRVSPHTPMIIGSWCMQLTSALSEPGKTLVSASTYANGA
jgi:hypothetical protein